MFRNSFGKTKIQQHTFIKHCPGDTIMQESPYAIQCRLLKLSHILVCKMPVI
uniref:Uncharacterized protein n=1 Tax=uncultured bacterium BLR12 TaxID=506514 RepID=C0ING4_9BACT|nr:hypothetical protein AKSOIL_0235 [uncultured bacterium BLR12]